MKFGLDFFNFSDLGKVLEGFYKGRGGYDFSISIFIFFLRGVNFWGFFCGGFDLEGNLLVIIVYFYRLFFGGFWVFFRRFLFMYRFC